MTARLLGRLVAALAVVLVGLVLPAAPAAASCARDIVGALEEEDHDVVFVGVDQRRVSDGDRLIVRFRVERVHDGEVRRTQDVVVGQDEESVGDVDWSPGDRVLVLGLVREDGVVTTSDCATAAEGSDGYDEALRLLGEGAAPLPGVDRIEPDGLSRRDLLWVRLVVGVVGFAALGVIALRWLRARRA